MLTAKEFLDTIFEDVGSTDIVVASSESWAELREILSKYPECHQDIKERCGSKFWYYSFKKGGDQ